MRMNYQKSLGVTVAVILTLVLVLAVSPIERSGEDSDDADVALLDAMIASESSLDLSYFVLEPVDHFIPEATLITRQANDFTTQESDDKEPETVLRADESAENEDKLAMGEPERSEADETEDSETEDSDPETSQIENTEATTAEPLFREVEYPLYVDAGALNMRAGPSTENAILTKLNLGSKVLCIGEHEEWVRVQHEDQTGYLSREYTSKSMVFVPVNQTRYVSANRLNLRAAPSADSEVLLILDHNAALTRTGIGDGWSKVTSASGTAGYVACDYLMEQKEVTETKPAEPEVIAASSQEGSTDEIALFKGVVNLEASSSSGYDGYLAVASVVLNRVDSSRFPNTIEGVLTQRNQFSVLGRVDRSRTQYSDTVEKAVRDALEGKRNMPYYVLFFASYSGYENNVARGGGFADVEVYTRAYGNVWCYDLRDKN